MHHISTILFIWGKKLREVNKQVNKDDDFIIRKNTELKVLCRIQMNKNHSMIEIGNELQINYE